MISLKTDKWQIDNIDAILFDKDGTLQDVHKYWGRIIEKRSKELINVLKLNQSYYQKLCKWMGYSLKNKKLLKKGPIGLVSREEVIKILADLFKKENLIVSEEFLSEIFIKVHKDFLKEMKKYVEILPEAKNFIQKLRTKKVKMAVITSDSIANAKESVRLLGLDGCFDLIMGREHTTAPKVSGIPARIAIKLLKVSKNKTVCFGDAPMDLIMANKAGLKVGIGIVKGQTSYKDLLSYSQFAIRSYNELKIIKEK